MPPAPTLNLNFPHLRTTGGDKYSVVGANSLRNVTRDQAPLTVGPATPATSASGGGAINMVRQASISLATMRARTARTA